MAQHIRKLKSLEDEKLALQARLESLEKETQQERKDLRLKQIHCLGEAVLKHLETGKLSQDFLASLDLRKGQTELFNDLFPNE